MTDPDRAAVAAAIRAVDSALAACEAARLALLVVYRPQETPTVDGECQHPLLDRKQVDTFSGVVIMCGRCGEQV